jgi:hypothetical protein
MITPSTPYIEADKVILSGPLKAGKDYVAEHSGHTVYGMADPMYRLANHFIGTYDKDIPGVRRFLQKVGAWGRAEVSEDYPQTAERWRISEKVRKKGAEITGIGTNMPEIWEAFGVRSDFWVQILDTRIQEAPEHRIAITNGRFPNEINHFVGKRGFAHRHVMCSEETRRKRLEEAGEEYDPDAEADVTEQLARELNAVALQQINLGNLYGPPEETEYPMISEMRFECVEDVERLDTVVWNDDPNLLPDSLRQQAAASETASTEA